MSAARYWQPGDPVAVYAMCARAQAEQLLPFDHHQVQAGRWGLLITYHLLALQTLPPACPIWIVYHPASAHQFTPAGVARMIRQHPMAPPAIQAAIAQLSFTWTATESNWPPQDFFP